MSISHNFFRFNVLYPIFLLLFNNKVESNFNYPSMNNSGANRAMLIKDNSGDWMIVVARWLRMKIGVPGTTSKLN